MNIFYDSTIFSRQTFGGISRYIVELINHLPDDVEPILGLRASDNIYLPSLKHPRRHVTLRGIPDHKHLARIINHRFDARIMKRGNYDVMHPTDYNTYLAGLNRKPYVVTVHDLILEKTHRPSQPRHRNMLVMEQCVKGADAIIAISEATKRDVMEIYGIDERKITVVHHGYTPASTIATSPLPHLGPYILYVGERNLYKNFATLLKAFAILAPRYPDLKLVCTGRPLTKDERMEIAAAGLTGRVVQQMFGTDQMHSLYANAECFVLPSLMEGFGMPILEAFAANCPVALSNTSCMPEIAGSGGAYFNPTEPEDMAASIERVLTDTAYRTELTSAAAQKLKEYSWEKTACQTANVYRTLCNA